MGISGMTSTVPVGQAIREMQQRNRNAKPQQPGPMDRLYATLKETNQVKEKQTRAPQGRHIDALA